MDKEIQERFYNAFLLINNHPALIGNLPGIHSLSIDVVQCCENGSVETDNVVVRRGEEKFEKFLGNGFLEHLSKESPEFDDIYVPYEVYYGYPWKFDHIEVWVEGGAYFYGKVDPNKDEWMWQSYHDVDLDTGGRSYEEAIISFAELVVEKYGNYSCSEFDEEFSIIPKWIRDNNKEEPMLGKDHTKWFKENEFNVNPNHIQVSDIEINTLWWHFHGRDTGLSGDILPDISMFLTREDYENFKNKLSN